MTRRYVALGLLLALAFSTSAFAEDIGQQKLSVDGQIAAATGKLAAQKQREAALRSQIDAVSARIQGLEAQVGDVSLRLNTLQQDLGLHQKRLHKLNQLFALQSTRLRTLQRQYKLSVDRLNQRLVAIYESDPVTTLDVVLGSGSIEAALDTVNYVKRISDEDKAVAAQVARSKLAMSLARKHTSKLRKRIKGEAHAIAARAAQARQNRAALRGAQGSLSSTKQQQLVALSSLSAQEQAEASEIDSLKAASAALAAQIRAAQQHNTGPTATRSSAGLIWPVSGPITSPFGWRWGRMHQGIDIGVPTGTPIRAAAAGKVIYCGWEEGYGNLVVLDNGGNLATAYGHQSAIAVTCGQDVTQDQVIGYVGCTGHCTGPHLHFEVRINGDPVDPLGYL